MAEPRRPAAIGRMMGTGSSVEAQAHRGGSTQSSRPQVRGLGPARTVESAYATRCRCCATSKPVSGRIDCLGAHWRRIRSLDPYPRLPRRFPPRGVHSCPLRL